MLITLLNTAIQDQSIQLSPPTSGGLEASRMIHDCALRLENMSHHDNQPRSKNIHLTNPHHPEPASSPTPTTTDFHSTGFYNTGIHRPAFRDAAFRCQC